MKVVVQRAKEARVDVEGETVGQIDAGFMLLVGITHDDEEADLAYAADKIANLRIFEDEEGKMNHSLLDVGGKVLSVSQFTLYGNCKKGRRPNFMAAAKPEFAQSMYERFNDLLRSKGIHVETGSFGTMMEVSFTNDGPVTLIIDSKE